MGNKPDIYGERDPRDLPLYPVSEAARYLHVSPSTLRSWVAGRSYPTRDGERFFEPLIQKPDPEDSRLSFINLVDAHVLRALRTKHGVRMRDVRAALDFAQEAYGIDRLLIRPELRTTARELFLDKYGELVNLSRAGQLAIRKVLEDYLERIEWDPAKLPVRLYPFTRNSTDRSRAIVIDPFVSFGRPIIRRKGISTAALADRIDAGERVEYVAQDYGLDQSEVEEAVVYERAA